jgi:hypothetical protein
MGVERKRGIGGGKATGAVLTGGLSTLATGLSQKQWMTKAHCDNCDSNPKRTLKAGIIARKAAI